MAEETTKKTNRRRGRPKKSTIFKKEETKETFKTETKKQEVENTIKEEIKNSKLKQENIAKEVKEQKAKIEKHIIKQESLSDIFIKRVLNGSIDITKDVNAASYLVSMAYYKVNGKIIKLDLMTALKYKKDGKKIEYHSGFMKLLPGTIIHYDK